MDYFTKWIEVIPTRQATDSVIISFLENNILSRFGCPNKLITDNATTFKCKRMIDFCHKYQITLGYSTTYYPQDRVSQKKSIGMSPLELVYGVDTVFSTSVAVPVVKLLQEARNEDDHLQRRINQIIHLQKTKEEVFQNNFKVQERIKKIYD
eukprot:PITA_09060